MKQMIFINKFNRIKKTIAGAVPVGSEVIPLDAQCALVSLPRAAERKTVLAACRECLGEEERSLLQPVTGYKENSESIEVALPGLKRFFKKPH